MTRPIICPYCGLEIGPEGFESEHAVPYGFGGGLKVPAHPECNHRLNDEVDEPLVKSFPAVKVRADFGIPNRHGKAPYPRSHQAEDEDGVPATLKFMPFGRAHVHRRPTEVPNDDGLVTVRFDGRESDDVKKEKCAAVEARTGRPANVEYYKAGGRQRLSVRGGPIPAYGWLRLAAKVGLAVGSLVAEPAWLAGETANHLREVLWAKPGESTHLTLAAAPTDLPEELAEVGECLLPPEHFLWVSHTPAGLASVCMFLFSEWFVPVPLALSAEEGELVRDYAWVMNPYKGKVTTEGPLDKVTLRLRARRPRVERTKEAHAAALRRVEAEVAAARAGGQD